MNNTLQSRNVVFTPELDVTVTFKGGRVFVGKLADLRDWAIANEADAPLGCVIKGERHGIFPCIIAENDAIARALTQLTGAIIQKDDGATFATRSQMKQVARSLALAGHRPTALACQWGVTDLPYANTIKPTLLTPQHNPQDDFFAVVS